MSTNPLFPSDDPAPASSASGGSSGDAAVRLIREKVARAYSSEPSAVEELEDAIAAKPPSKHQLFMRELSASGKSLAEIQTAWHQYYVDLPDDEKREVWAEFYEANQQTPYQKLFQKQQASVAKPTANQKVIEPLPQTKSQNPLIIEQAATPVSLPTPTADSSGVVVASYDVPKPPAKPHRRRTAAKAATKKNTRAIKKRIVNRVSAGGRLKAKHHIQSLLFGFGMGSLVLLILLFSFFNEYVIAPFIQPSRTVSATPIIIGNSALSNGTPEVIIPKINVQIPLDFNVQSDDENAIEAALNGGVVHYPSTVMPGQNGNAAFFGHSSNNIFNPGKYKFAFVLLHTLTTGDIFYITYNGQTYAYQVFAREIVEPSQVSVLNDTKGKTATATLITCDPPGTSLHRLVVWGEQISPGVAGNTAGAAPPAASTNDTQLASNGPTLWSRFVNFVEFWN